ncbi:MAG: hypothetical protein AAB270_00215 [Chloroflexota bacterium]
MRTENLTDMDQQQLQEALETARMELQDLYELRHGFMGQSGVHVGARLLTSARRQFEREEARLKERIAVLEGLLRRDGNPAREGGE